MIVALSERYAWQTRSVGPCTVHSCGDHAAADTVARALAACANPGADEANRAMHDADGHFALIVEGPGYLLAGVDHCRSYPLFHATQTDGQPLVSNDARLVKSRLNLDSVDRLSALEAAMAGFVSGPYTLFDGLRQLQAGELLWHDARSGCTDVRQYYVYAPVSFNAAPEGELIEQLGAVTDRAMQQVVRQADGAPIWVPLSAGLDSRLILCKLVELSYDNLFAFSYGPAGNDEAKAARGIAERLGVRWRFWPSRSRDMRQLYASRVRSDYWAFGDGLSSLPNLQDFPTLYGLKQRGEIPANAVIVNGQTGDFISGGHIPKALWEGAAPSADGLFDAIVAKHYSLWRSLKTPENLAQVRERVWDNLGIKSDDAPSREQAAALFERHEYQERQAKHIVNGQRNYDYLGLSWALPLWNRGIVDFWRDVPPEHKYRQRLYRRYLDAWNFKGLFKGFAPVVWQWPGTTKAVLPLFRAARLLFGVASRDRMIRNMLYFGMYRHMYAPFGYRYFLRHAQNLRNPISLLSRHWLDELGVSVAR